MNIDIKDRVTLNDNNEYVVVSKTNYQKKTYYYLVDMNNNENIKFCVETSNNSLSEVFEETIIQNLLPLFIKASKQFIPKIDV